MSTENSFQKSYPISIAGALFVPLVFKNVFAEPTTLPYPRLAGMRPFAEYAGYGYGTVRTILAKWKRESLVETVGQDEPHRYRLNSLMATVAATKRERPKELVFTILVFSFAGGSPRERSRMRQILGHFGFRRFAQNSYANVNFDDAGLRRILADAGMTKSAYLFSFRGEDDPEQGDHLGRLWDYASAAASAKRFAEALPAFLAVSAAGDEAAYDRYFYAATAYYEHFTAKLPNVPEERITRERSLSAIEQLLEETRAANAESIVRHYARINL